jgi:hypothetical protein
MATAVESDARLRETEGFVVESPDGDLGWVEEVWVGEANEARALAVRTADGRHGLLLEDEVLAVDRENRWVVVPAEPALLELAAPRLTVAPDEREPRTAVASWTTTGELLPVAPRRPRLPRFLARHWRAGRRGRAGRRERPLWQSIAVLIGSLMLLVAFTITVAFLIADLVTGAPY